MSLQDCGVPVRGGSAGLLWLGRGQQGDEILFASIEQTDSILVVDLKSGHQQTLSLPQGCKTTRVGHWSHRHEIMVLATTTSPAHSNREVAILTWTPGSPLIMEQLTTFQANAPVSMVEGIDGYFYIGCYDQGNVVQVDPVSGNIQIFQNPDPENMYAYVSIGSDGQLACLFKMVSPQVQALDPSTACWKRIGPVVNVQKQDGFVECVRGKDGLLYVRSHAGLFRIHNNEGERVEDVVVDTEDRRTKPRYLDGNGNGLTFKEVEIPRANGKHKIVHLDYTPPGSHIYHVRPGPNGKIYGGSALPLHFFEYDPKAGKSHDYGQASSSSGQIYSMGWMDNQLYFAVYTHGILCVYDPTRPWDWPTDVEGAKNMRKNESFPIDHAYYPGRIGSKQRNPRQLGRMDPVAYRPRAMVCGPAGKVWVASVCDYGMWGGTLSWYDPVADCFGGAHRHIIENTSPQALCSLGTTHLAVGFSIYGGSGTQPKATSAGFACWDADSDCAVWVDDLGLAPVGVMDLIEEEDGVAVAVVHCPPENERNVWLMRIDFLHKRILESIPFPEACDWPLEVTLQADADFIVGLTRRSVYRMRRGTLDLEILWQSQDETIEATAGGALLDDVYYFGCHERLMALPTRTPPTEMPSK